MEDLVSKGFFGYWYLGLLALLCIALDSNLVLKYGARKIAGIISLVAGTALCLLHIYSSKNLMPAVPVFVSYGFIVRFLMDMKKDKAQVLS